MMLKFLERFPCTISIIFTSSTCSYSITSVIIEYYNRTFFLILITISMLISPLLRAQKVAPDCEQNQYNSFYHYFLSMEKLRETFQRAWRGVIAPNRFQYNINSICSREQMIDNHLIQRIDFTVPRDDGSNISAFLLKEKNIPVKDAILYLHGNGGSKIQIIGVLPIIAENNVALISFDFVGCGNSDPGYLTYGIQESADAEIVLREAYKYLDIEKLTVWGRSMGAVTAIMFAAKNHKIVDKLVLDSPFKCLEAVIRRVIDKQTGLPNPLVSLLLYFLKKEIEQRVKLPLFSQDYMQHFKKIPKTLSVLFICSDNDSIVPKTEVEQFYRAFKGDRQLLEIVQGHEQDRGIGVYKEILRWVRKQKSRKTMKLRLYRPEQCFQCEQEQVYTIC